MTTAYTPILQLALPVTGELNGTWGTTVNDNITSMIEQAIAGLATINTWTTASHTLTTADGTTDEARCAMLECSGAPGAAATVVCPARTKLFVIKNSVTGGYAVTLKTASGTGISVPNGSTALLYCDGTNVVSGATYMATLVTTSITDSGLTSGRVVYAGTGGLLQDAAAFTFDGTILSATRFAGALNGTVGATTPSTGVFTSVTNSSLTSGRVLYAGTGGLVQDAAAFTFDGTILSATRFAGALNGTVGATTPAAGAFTTISASTPLPVSSGGTGAATLTANNVILGNGTSSPLFVAPSTTGNVLTSNGTTWVSAVVTATGDFPSGTVIPFFQAAAPTGWTQVTTHNNKSLRVVSTTGGGSGGTVNFTTAFSSQSVGATAITTAQMPSHSHGVTDPSHSHSGGDYGHQHSYNSPTGAGGSALAGGGDLSNSASAYNTSTGNASVYINANTTGISIAANGSGATHTHTLDLAVQYVDIILASKN